MATIDEDLSHSSATFVSSRLSTTCIFSVAAANVLPTDRMAN